MLLESHGLLDAEKIISDRLLPEVLIKFWIMVLYLGNSQKERQLDQAAFSPNVDSEKQ